MHKINSVTHLKGILKEVLLMAFQHMQSLVKEINELNVTEENRLEKKKEDIIASNTLNQLLTILNDVIHPAHDVASSLFDDAYTLGLIKMCIANQDAALKAKFITGVCKCQSCKMKAIG